jgi:hypothetical protein
MSMGIALRASYTAFEIILLYSPCLCLKVTASTARMTVFSRLAVLGALAAPLSQASALCAADNSVVVQNTTEYWPYQVYETSDINAPYMNITTTGEPLADGLIFFGQNIRPGTHTVKQQRPFIMTDTNDLVWSGPMEQGISTTDFKVATMNGSSVLVYWSSIGQQPIEGIGYGQVNILDDTYQQIATVCPQLNLTLTPGATSKCDADLHEHYITPSNTMLVTAYNVTQADLTPLGGKSDDWVLDPLAVEVDIATGEILFTWSSVEHIPVNNTQVPYPAKGTTQDTPFDLYHMNSIQSVDDNYLINCRHTFSTYMVNKDGDILWTIQGHTGGDFGSLPEGGTYVSTPIHCPTFFFQSILYLPFSNAVVGASYTLRARVGYYSTFFVVWK